MLALVRRSRPSALALLSPQPAPGVKPAHAPPAGFAAGFTAPDAAHTFIAWRLVWTQLLHESVIADPALRVLLDENEAVATDAAEVLAGLLAPPLEQLVLHEVAWTHPLCGAVPEGFLTSFAAARGCCRCGFSWRELVLELSGCCCCPSGHLHRMLATISCLAGCCSCHQRCVPVHSFIMSPCGGEKNRCVSLLAGCQQSYHICPSVTDRRYRSAQAGQWFRQPHSSAATQQACGTSSPAQPQTRRARPLTRATFWPATLSLASSSSASCPLRRRCCAPRALASLTASSLCSRASWRRAPRLRPRCSHAPHYWTPFASSSFPACQCPAQVRGLIGPSIHILAGPLMCRV